ncbi:PREDICTED: uncharacterized protein LOC108616476 [Drosophila arizonae]|uniref:Uncharacterized protein LOC108616476 n=1 Tax=Drosophila arizonae TaxID=7263 RepID=A0ABM1PIY8_DROAR|nr:PREDICTED: uncharacterized protein LOC108616476 [Drosophila arizonae]
MERSQSCSNFEGAPEALHASVGGVNKPLTGSSDNLPHRLASCNSSSNMLPSFPPSKPLRKRKRLQRQQSVNVDDADDDDHHDLLSCECAYAADLEENDDGDLEMSEPLVMPRLPQRHILANSGRQLRHEESFDSNSTAPEMSPQAVRQHRFSSLLLRDSSVSMQSDSSRYSSVDSLLESRKPDPEAILINLGFGPVGTEDMLSRIPKRFLKPSKVPGIDTEAFVKRLQLASSLADSSALGYRGLTSSSDQPPSSIVAKIMERFEVNNQRKQSMGNIEHTIR